MQCFHIYEKKKIKDPFEKNLPSTVEDVLRESQHGFLPWRGTAYLVFARKIILEKSWEWNIKRYAALLDLEKSSDRALRQTLRRVFREDEYQITEKSN